MKKLLIVFFLLVLNFTLKAQYPVTQFLGSDSTVIYIKGAARTVGGFINGVYTDTAAANLTRIRQYQAAQIFTTNDSAIWFRMPGATKWVRIMPATPPSPNVDTSYWSLSGNYVADRVATPKLGTTTGHELNIITNDSIRLTIPVYGIRRVTGNENRYLVIDTTIGSNMYVGYMDGGSGSTYTAGNGLTLSGSQFKLGGTLSENTHLFGANKRLTADSLNYFDFVSRPNTYASLARIRANGSFDEGTSGVLLSSSNEDNTDSSYLKVSGTVELNSWGQDIRLKSIPTVSSTTGRKVALIDTATGKVERIDPASLIGGNIYVDSLWRVAGKDSIFWLKNGTTYKFKDSTGGISNNASSAKLADSTFLKSISIDTFLYSEIKRIADYVNSQNFVRATDGTNTPFYYPAPGYPNFYLRDFSYTLDGVPSLVSSSQLDSILTWVNSKTPRSGGNAYQAPDYISQAGSATFGVMGGSRSILDNNTFFVDLVYKQFKNGSTTFYSANKSKIDSLITYGLPYLNGAVYVADRNVGQSAYQDYGFTDAEFKSGYPLFINVLTYVAYNQLYEINDYLGNNADAALFVLKRDSIKRLVNDTLFDRQYGLYKAASIKCSGQYDIWGSAFAVFSGLADDSTSYYVSQKLKSTINDWYYKGGIRHVALSNEYNTGVSLWETYIGSGVVSTSPTAGNPYNSWGGYQNGAYWATPFPWVFYTIQITDRALADKMLNDVVSTLREANKNFTNSYIAPEWWSQSKGPYNMNYAASSAMPLLGVIKGNLASSTVDQKRAIIAGASYTLTSTDDIVIGYNTTSLTLPKSFNYVGQVKTIVNYFGASAITLSGATVNKSGSAYTSIPAGSAITMVGTVSGDSCVWLVVGEMTDGAYIQNQTAAAQTASAWITGTLNLGGASSIPSQTKLYLKETGSSTTTWRGRLIAGGDNVAFVMGEYASKAWLGGQNAALNAWADLYINPDGGANLYLGDKDGSANNATTPIISIINTSAGKVGVGTTNPDSTFHIVGSLKLANGTEGAGKILISDASGGASWQVNKVNLVFGAGSGADADTSAFTTSAIYGSFFTEDTIVVTSFRAVLQGTGADVTYKIWYNDSLNVEAGATALNTAGNQVTNLTTGTNVTSITNTKIPPNVWVWVKTSTVATKPKYFSLTLNGYRK